MLYSKKDLHLLKVKSYADSFQYTLSTVREKRKSLISNKVNEDESLRCSISRSCSLIKELALCNSFDYFFTLTLKDYSFRTDTLTACKYLLYSIKKYSRLSRRRGFDFKYMFVFEKQKKGGLHVHGYFSGFYDLYINSNGYLSSTFFDRVGFQNFSTAVDVNPFYLIKYIIKEPVKEMGHLFYRSRGLKKAEVSYLHDNLGEFENYAFVFENDYCRMVTIKK